MMPADIDAVVIEQNTPPRPRLGVIALRSVLVLAAMMGVLFVFSVLPGMVPNLHNAIDSPSMAKCLSNAFASGGLRCSNIGYPAGIPIVFGLPVVAPIAILGQATGLDYFAIAAFVYTAFFAVALLGGIAFFRLFTRNWPIAVFGAAVFMVSPVVSGQQGFGPLRIGFALLPTYLYLTVRCFESLRQGKPLSQLAWVLVLCGVQLFALFCDGYSFVMACVAGLACCVLYQGVPGSTVQWWELGKRLLAYLGATALAYLAYRSYVPSAVLQAMPLDFFRGQGVDVFTMFLPSTYLWFFQATDLHHAVGGSASYSFGADIKYGYLGYSFLIASVVAAVLAWRKQVPARGLTVAVLLAGLLAAGLSLGPSLKVADFRPEASQTGNRSFDGYKMPADAATLDLHTGWVYEHVPGIKVMRAVYRWALLLRLGLVLALVVVLAWLVRDRRFVLAALLGLLALLESVPDVSDNLKISERIAASLRMAHDEAIPDFRRHVRHGEKVVLVQMHDRPAGNQYAASFFCSWGEVSCYNVGGDKTVEIAKDRWPAEIEELVFSKNIEDNIGEALLDGDADVVVTPFFDLRKVAYDFPGGMVPREPVHERLRAIADDLGLQLAETRYFASLRPGPGFDRATCGLRCWKDWKDASIIDKVAWGPKNATVGVHFNEQANGRSALWIKSAELKPGMGLAFGPLPLATFLKGQVASAQPSSRYDTNLPAGRYPVYLLDRPSRRKQLLGELTISPPSGE